MSNNARVKVTIELEYAFGAVGDEWTIKELRERTARNAKQAAEDLCETWVGKHRRTARVVAIGVPVCEIGPEQT